MRREAEINLFITGTVATTATFPMIDHYSRTNKGGDSKEYCLGVSVTASEMHHNFVDDIQKAKI